MILLILYSFFPSLNNLIVLPLPSPQSLMVPYRVTVYTSDIRGAGTSGEVYFSMKGSHGATGESRLENHRDNFSRNQTDVFEVVSSDIGIIEEVTVRLVRPGGGGQDEV